MNNLFLKIIVLVLSASACILAQISPGELTSAHKDLEGLSNCTKCHELGEKVLKSKCLDCHSEIKSLVSLNMGYHSSSEVKNQECTKCHPEHFGRNFRIINFDPDGFDHNNAGYELTGSHAKLKCDKCHQPNNIIDPEIAIRKGTYLGLSSNCSGCHEDYHRKTLGDNCASCHNTEKFNPAIKFNHDKAKFKLTGKHQTVNCLKCHPRNKLDGGEFQKFTGIQFTNCFPCHQDKHNGRFGLDCKTCHVTSGFTQINKSQFDHNKTEYPLIGKHKIVSCNKCHQTGLKQKLRYDKCIDCHSDYHELQFITEGQITDCVNCHTVKDFRPSIIDEEKHSKFKFVTDGAHLAIPCQNCHIKEKKWRFVNLGRDCISCHKDVHGNEIIEKYSGNKECIKCHQTESWSTINFDHNRTEFELFGKHKKQKCKACHYQQKIASGGELLFKSLGKNCEVCHIDVHAGQFKEGEISVCTRCHSYDDWKPDKFDHEKTRFKLKGAHEKLKCNQCHRVIELADIKFIKYILEDFKCSDCHK